MCDLHGVRGLHNRCHRSLLHQRGCPPRGGDHTWNQSRNVEVHRYQCLDVCLHRRRVLDADGQDNRGSRRANDGPSTSSSFPFSVSDSHRFKWYDTLWVLRHAFFITLPLITHFALPSALTPSPLAIAPQTNFALQALHRRVQLLKFTSVITLRVPEFRQAAGNYWETQRMEGRWAREDHAINRLFEKTGTGMKREVARELASKFKRGFEL